MDWNHKCRLMVQDENGVLMVNKYIFDDILIFDFTDVDWGLTYIINSEFIGKYIMIKYKQNLLPCYILNQNYIRFNKMIINLDQLNTFLHRKIALTENSYIPLRPINGKNIELLIQYNFSLHHVHHNNYNNYNTRSKKEKNGIGNSENCTNSSCNCNGKFNKSKK